MLLMLKMPLRVHRNQKSYLKMHVSIQKQLKRKLNKHS